MLDELELVRALGADTAEPSAHAGNAARVALLEAIRVEAHGSARIANRQTPRRRQRHRRMTLTAGLVAAGVVAAGVLGFHTATNPQSALAAQMNRLATIAASQDWTGIPGPGQYLYTDSKERDRVDVGKDRKSCVISLIDDSRIWIATDGSGAESDAKIGAAFTSASDQATCESIGITDPTSQVGSGGTSFPAGGLSFPTDDWHALSTDPATLLRQIHAIDGGPDTAAEDFVNLADVMRESDVPPVLRAALYRAAALIPGVKLLGAQTDPTGQLAGLGVAFDNPDGDRSELIFDQRTGRMLAEEYFGADGKLSTWISYIRQAIVDSHPDYPSAGSPG